MVTDVRRENKLDIAITLLHIAGMIMIFLCHVFQAEKIYFVSEILISGVPLFLFVSGYLAGLKNIAHPLSWFLKKAKRILVPYWIFIVLIYGSYGILNLSSVTPFQWIFSLLDLQGLNYTYWKFEYFGAVEGCGHLWFVTTIMLCYALTPLMQRIKSKASSKISFTIWSVVLFGLQLIFIYLGFQLSYVFTFFLGFLLAGKEWRKGNKHYLYITMLMAAFMGIRLVARRFVDGTDFYDRFWALVSATAIAAWLFYTVYYFKNKIGRVFELLNCRVVHFIEKISYCFYITHYIFLWGPYSVFHYIDNKWIGYIVVAAFSFISAIILYYLTERIIFVFLKRKKV
ncbi:MAG: acyltransferase [Clostridia bacterium]|nr:acyltransferase [Clostridia bacterium]